jgi:uncharacterized cupredoxin-like copper-binding protein
LAVNRVAILLAALAASASACGGETEKPGNVFGKPATTVKVTLSDFRIEPSKIKLGKPGIYTFVARNEGTVNHVFEVESNDLESETSEVPPGKTGELTIRLRENRYKIYCPLDRHEEKGMRGTMVVRSPGPATTGEAEN